jgi:four helix bundle protein
VSIEAVALEVRVAARGFEDLLVYRRVAALADELRATVRTWDSIDTWTAGVQAIRAADSIGANIAEATGRVTNPDRLRLLFIARGSVNELEHWLARAEARHLPSPAESRARAQEIGRMLNGLIASIKT